jgi:endoglucanase
MASASRWKISQIIAGIFVLTLLLTAAWFVTNRWPRTLEGDPANWQRYKHMFISGDGRVIDTGNKGVSHSEGQGWGMLLAVENDDRETFDLLWNWTRSHLQIREDKLFAWKWLPSATDNPVPDKNNASDGDVYIAWSLLRASRRWGGEAYVNAARAILVDIRQWLVKPYGGQIVLLPGRQGFEHPEYLMLNLSYWVFPAFEEFDEADPHPIWRGLRESGIAIIGKARFGQWRLPPDWAMLKPNGELVVAKDFPPRFGFDAIRVPLAMYWGGIDDAVLFKPYQNLLEAFDRSKVRPAWVNLEDNSVAPYDASPGMKGIMDIARSASLNETDPPSLPQVSPEQDYYAASLVMLSRQATAEVARR